MIRVLALVWRQQKINNCYKIFSITFFFFFVISSFLCIGHYALAQTNQTSSKLQAANAAVNGAFNAVLDAEKAGANVTKLLAQLNIAASILAQAENSNRAGVSNSTAVLADSVIPIAEVVTASAQEAKQSALVSAKNALWSIIAFTVIAGIVFVLALFLVWRRLKRSNTNSLSEAKPRLLELAHLISTLLKIKEISVVG